MHAQTLMEWLENLASSLVVVTPCTAVTAWRMSFVDYELVMNVTNYFVFLPGLWRSTAMGGWGGTPRWDALENMRRTAQT